MSKVPQLLATVNLEKSQSRPAIYIPLSHNVLAAQKELMRMKITSHVKHVQLVMFAWVILQALILRVLTLKMDTNVFLAFIVLRVVTSPPLVQLELSVLRLKWSQKTPANYVAINNTATQSAPPPAKTAANGQTPPQTEPPASV